MSFSLPSCRYFQRQSLPPAGVIQRYRPPPSLRRYAVSFALALRTPDRSAPFSLQKSPLREKYPQVKTKVPPEIPPAVSGFHSTALDVKRRKPQFFLGFFCDVWIFLDVLKQVNGGEGGIRTPDTREGMSDFESGAFNWALPPLRVSILPKINRFRKLLLFGFMPQQQHRTVNRDVTHFAYSRWRQCVRSKGTDSAPRYAHRYAP